MINVLILSAGTRNKIINYFVKELAGRGNVIATDMSSLAPALYEADKYYIVPRMTDKGYIDKIFEICEKEEVSGVLSLIDPELSLLAEHAEEFRVRGTMVIGSSAALCELALDKFRMYQWLTIHGYPCAASYIDLDLFRKDLEQKKAVFPVVVKPVKGSASISVSKVLDEEEVEFMSVRNGDFMIQEFLDGQEIGADVYIDMLSGEIISIFTKKKLKMRAGETDKAVSFKDEKLFRFIAGFVKEAGFRGQIDIDIFDVNGVYYISEVNPRFGGGYPHAYESGCNHMKMIIENLSGRANDESIGDYEEGIYMMKYNEIKIKELDDVCRKINVFRE